jgi:hypothetical protein
MGFVVVLMMSNGAIAFQKPYPKRDRTILFIFKREKTTNIS